jgi:hypothetical protein
MYLIYVHGGIGKGAWAKINLKTGIAIYLEINKISQSWLGIFSQSYRVELEIRMFDSLNEHP